METFKLYQDLEDTPRRYGEETSDFVVEYWTCREDRFPLEDVPDDAPVERREHYWRMTAERILLRRKVLDLPVVPAETLDREDLLGARPFADSDRPLKDFLRGDVKVAMAYVPLTPLDGDTRHRAELARLYCVSGLSPDGHIPFSDSKSPPGSEQYSWFLCGCEKNPPPRGESWHLAAGLLMWVLREGDTKAVRNLAGRFIVTGRVDFASGRILPVDMGRKPELEGMKELKHLTWLLSIENKEEMNEMKKTESVKTLEEACELIKTMQKGVTRSLARMMGGDSVKPDAVFPLLESGADATFVDSEIGLNAHQAYAQGWDRRFCGALHHLSDLIKARKNDEAAVVLCTIGHLMNERRDIGDAMSYYGNVSQMFFMLAKDGHETMLANMANVYDINALDNSGRTALDYAIERGEQQVAEVLKNNHATLRGDYLATSDRMLIALCDLHRGAPWKEDVDFICEALENGCDPNAVIELGETFCLKLDWKDSEVTKTIEVELDPAYGQDPYEERFREDRKIYAWQGRVYATTILLAALVAGDEKLVKACMEHGGDLNVQVRCALAQKLTKEIFAASEKETVEHNPEFSDTDFLYKEYKSIGTLADLVAWKMVKQAREWAKTEPEEKVQPE